MILSGWFLKYLINYLGVSMRLVNSALILMYSKVISSEKYLTALVSYTFIMSTSFSVNVKEAVYSLQVNWKDSYYSIIKNNIQIYKNKQYISSSSIFQTRQIISIALLSKVVSIFHHAFKSSQNIFPLSKMAQRQQYTKHFALYSVTSIIFGLTFSGLGPLIPYLADISNTKETDYAFAFLTRAIGMIFGSFFFNYLQKKKIFNYHQLIAIDMLGIAITCTTFTFSTFKNIQGTSLFFNGFFNGLNQTLINFSIIKLSTAQNLQFIFLIVSGMFGLGGLLGPAFISFLQENTFFFFGVLAFISAPLYLLLQSSDKISKQLNQNKPSIDRDLPQKGAYMLYLLFLMYVGLICCVGGWISSYAVMDGANTKEEAVIYPSLFWSSVTFSRIIIAFIPGSCNGKLKICLQASFVVTILSLVLKLIGFVKIALVFQTLILGIAISTVCPMIYAISKSFGYELKAHQLSFLIAAGPIGEGILTYLTGELMSWISIDMFFYTSIFYTFTMVICRIRLISLFERNDSQRNTQKDQLQQQLVKIQKS